MFLTTFQIHFDYDQQPLTQHNLGVQKKFFQKKGEVDNIIVQLKPDQNGTLLGQPLPFGSIPMNLHVNSSVSLLPTAMEIIQQQPKLLSAGLSSSLEPVSTNSYPNPWTCIIYTTLCKVLL